MPRVLALKNLSVALLPNVPLRVYMSIAVVFLLFFTNNGSSVLVHGDSTSSSSVSSTGMRFPAPFPIRNRILLLQSYTANTSEKPSLAPGCIMHIGGYMDNF